jgi:putrescine transport system permease protein
LSALVNAACTMIGCVVIGFPIALAIAQAPRARRNLVCFSRGASVLDLVSDARLRLDRVDPGFGADQFSFVVAGTDPSIRFPCCSRPAAVWLVMVYSYLPFFVLPMYAVLESLPAELLAAAPIWAQDPPMRFEPSRCRWRCPV